MGFLRDYVSIFPAIIAVMNGALAVFSAHYPFKTPMAKVVFIVIIISFSIAAIGATFYSQYLVVAERAKERGRTLMVREQLGTFIAEGTNLLNLAATASAPAPTDQANTWAVNIESFLAANMGGSYVVRFRDSTGMPPVYKPGIDEQHQNLWQGIYSRMLRLERFSEEIPR